MGHGDKERTHQCRLLAMASRVGDAARTPRPRANRTSEERLIVICLLVPLSPHLPTLAHLPHNQCSMPYAQ
ncbi:MULTISPECIES: hypothetical protein [Nostoc]|uniref:hypothetical protein n=1 Tax=Nostoc TaxID=1177 RepID=UPI001688AA24|nr:MULTISPECIES: hypothetical protein [Nostoc]